MSAEAAAAGLTEAQAGLIASAAQTVGGISGLLGGFNQARINRKYNAREAEKARAWAREQWRLENEYNSPAAQMQRYIEAGLNPNLIYGDLGNGLNTAPAAAQASGSPSGASVGNPVDSTGILQGRLIEAQIKRLETQNQNDSKMTDANIQRFAVLNNVSEADVRKADAEISLTNERAEETRQAVKNMQQQWDILEENKKQEKFETAFLEATQSLKIEATNEQNRAIQETAVALATAQVLNVKADTALKWSQAALNKQYGKESQSRIRLNNVEMAVARNQASLIAEQIQGQQISNESTMWKMSRDRSYAEHVYGVEGESWFWRSVHYFTSEVDAVCRCLGQILSFSK